MILYYPKEDEDEEEKIKDNQKKRVEDNQEMIEDTQNNENPPDTADLGGIVAFLEQTPNRSPRSSLMLRRFERALGLHVEIAQRHILVQDVEVSEAAARWRTEHCNTT